LVCVPLQELYEATMQRMCSTLDFNVFKSQMATFTLGSGAVAAILCRSDLAPPGRNHRLTGAVSRCAPYTRDMCRARYEKMTTDTKMVLHGVKVVGQTWEVAQRELGMSKENVDLFVPHQVSKKAHTIGAHMLGISPDELVATYPFTGNVGPASIGIALSIEEKEGRVKEGQRVCLISFGSGINCIVAEVMW
jgi:3-oxoacyl-[acyl-carrier-protein] synthase-3